MKPSTRRNLEIGLSLLAVAAVGAGVVWAYQPAAAGGSAPKPTGGTGGTTGTSGGTGGSGGSSGSGTAGASGPPNPTPAPTPTPTPTPAPPTQPWENTLTPGNSMRAYVHTGTTLKLDAPSGGTVLSYRYGNSHVSTPVNASSVTLPAQTVNGTYVVVWQDSSGNTLTSTLTVGIV